VAGHEAEGTLTLSGEEYTFAARPLRGGTACGLVLDGPWRDAWLALNTSGEAPCYSASPRAAQGTSTSSSTRAPGMRAETSARTCCDWPRLVAAHDEQRSLVEFLHQEFYSFTGEGWGQEDDITLTLGVS
jgi:hypothetical protein